MSDLQKPFLLPYRYQILLCVGSKCTSDGEGLALYEELKHKIKVRGLAQAEHRVIRSAVSCLGACQSGPLICVQPDGVWYYGINSQKLDRILDEHIENHRPVLDFIYHQN